MPSARAIRSVRTDRPRPVNRVPLVPVVPGCAVSRFLPPPSQTLQNARGRGLSDDLPADGEGGTFGRGTRPDPLSWTQAGCCEETRSGLVAWRPIDAHLNHETSGFSLAFLGGYGIVKAESSGFSGGEAAAWRVYTPETAHLDRTVIDVLTGRFRMPFERDT